MAEKSKRQKLDSNEENVVQCRPSENIENVTLQENQFQSQHLQIYEHRNDCITPEVILHWNTGTPGDDTESGPLRGDYCCNSCSNVITGRRYACVQCADVDLCAACEAVGLHALHYVLRVPGGKPEEEITSVLEKIRAELFKLDNTVESIQIQIKEELDPLAAVEDIYIDTLTSADNRPMSVEIPSTEINAEEDIPHKIRRVELEEYMDFKHQSPPDHTAQLHLAVTTYDYIGDTSSELPDVKDIKVEVDVDTSSELTDVRDIKVEADVDTSSELPEVKDIIVEADVYNSSELPDVSDIKVEGGRHGESALCRVRAQGRGRARAARICDSRTARRTPHSR